MYRWFRNRPYLDIDLELDLRSAVAKVLKRQTKPYIRRQKGSCESWTLLAALAAVPSTSAELHYGLTLL